MSRLFCSLFFHFSEPLGDVETHEIIEVAVINLFFFDDDPHFASVAASHEVNKDDDSIKC